MTPPLKPASGASSKNKKTKAAKQLDPASDVEDAADSSTKDGKVNTTMIDRYGEHFTFYPGVPPILHAAKQKGIAMSLASRTHAPELAREMLRGIYISPPATSEEEEQSSPTAQPMKAASYFLTPQIYPGSKTTHFRKLQALTKSDKTNFPAGSIAYEDMIFFDDEARNRNVETELGAVFVLVRDGVTVGEVDRGVQEWRRRKGIAVG